MVSFNHNDEDDEDSWVSDGKKFGVCDTSDECYACTGRIVINLELCQVEETLTSDIDEDETITFCENCIQSMMRSSLVGISYDPVDAFSWQRYFVVAFHPDSIN